MLYRKYAGPFFNQPDDKGSGANPDDLNGSQSDSEGGSDYQNPDAYAKALEKRIAERDAELQRLKDQQKDYDALKKAQQKSLEEQGNFKALYEKTQSELAKLSDKAEGYDSLVAEIRDSNETRIEALPADQQNVVRLLAEKLSPVDLRRWLDNAEGSVIGKRTAPSTGAGRGVNSPQGAQLTADEQAIAKRAGMTDEQYLEAKRKALGE